MRQLPEVRVRSLYNLYKDCVGKQQSRHLFTVRAMAIYRDEHTESLETLWWAFELANAEPVFDPTEYAAR